jgi:hypothetical protein
VSLLPDKQVEFAVDFTHADTIADMLEDDSFVVGIKGPVGSGKSFGCSARIMDRALRQKPSPVDNIRYTRWAVVRNSYPELKTTTLKTWTDLFPENRWGRLLWTPPITHHIRMPARGKTPGVDCEVIFLALDQPKDVRKLLSLELTGAWVNEARELPKAVIDGLTHRVGRYPPKRDGGPTWRGVWMDTNPMDDDHWWYQLAVKGEKPHGRFKWKFYDQPPAVVELPGTPPDEEKPFCIFAAGKWWRVNEDAENIANLPDGYYEQLMGNKKLDWIRCYAGGQYVFVQDGRPVWPEYDDTVMVGEPMYDPQLPLQLGLDFGLTPAAVFGQKTRANVWNILGELPMFDMGLERFGQALLGEIALQFPKAQVIAWGDPAGEQRDPIYETTAFQYLASIGIKARPTDTNDPNTRREAGAAPMGRMVSGKPALQIHEKCKWLRKSLAGGFHFKRVAVAGRETFRDKANKNEYSHIGDAFGYLMLGGGEYRKLTRNASLSPGFGAVATAQTDFDVWAA